jgi:MFS family permease
MKTSNIATQPGRRPTSINIRTPFLALLVANAISLVGSTLTSLAIPWFVLATTGSAARTGVTAFCQALAVVIASFVGGAFVDRLGHKRASVIADLGSGLIVMLIPLLHQTTGLAFWQLLVLVFVRSFFDTPGSTARAALLPDVAALAGISLERANASVQAVSRGARLLGAPLAGILIAAIGSSQVLWIDAATFFASAAVIAGALSHKVTPVEPRKHFRDEIATGLRFIWNDRLLRSIVGAVAITNLFESPIFAVILPVYVQQKLGSAISLGLLIASVGGGALLGALVFGALGPHLPRRVTYMSAFILLGLAYSMLALFPSLTMGVGALILAGFAAGPINPIIETVMQERVPSTLRGRVFGTMTATVFVMIPIGMVLAGYLLEWVGIQTTLLVIATCYLVVTLSMLINPAFREMDRHRVSKNMTQDRPNVDVA